MQIFHGNKDRTSVVSHNLGNTIKSSNVRFWPLNKHNFISMRTELYGCLAGKSFYVTFLEDLLMTSALSLQAKLHPINTM